MILESVERLPSRPVDFAAAGGRILHCDLLSPEDIPPFDNSAMDGYALIASETEQASADSPVTFRVPERIFAGMLPRYPVAKGDASAIMTGAPVPEGADAVVMKEYTHSCGDRVSVSVPVSKGENIRRQGEERKPGEILIPGGTLIDAASIGMCALMGITTIQVLPAPRVALIATGNELVDPREPGVPGKIRNANSYALAALVRGSYGEPLLQGIARDTEEDLREKLSGALETADVVITAAGISVGEGDLVRQVLLQMGARMSFWKVAIRPGKPTAFGFIKGKPIFCLPGNPVSAMVTFEQFVRPALLKMAGHTHLFRPVISAIVEEEIKKKQGIHYFFRVTLKEENGRVLASLTGPQGSGMLSSMVYAHGLMSVPEEAGMLCAGDRVQVQLLKESAEWSEKKV
jgi:molybdopterin molybdotransferase